MIGYASPWLSWPCTELGRIDEAISHGQQAESLYRRLGDPSSLDYELRHKNIIAQFGRYPHRNEILGRESTEEEKEFLQEPGSSF